MLLNDKKKEAAAAKGVRSSHYGRHFPTDDTTLEKVYTSLPYIYSLYPHVGVDVFY